MTLQRAVLVPFDQQGQNKVESAAITLDFNPETLTIKVQNSLQDVPGRKDRQRVQFAFAQLVGEARDQAVYGPVKEQFGDEIRALTDAEQDSKELKSAKRHALVDQISRTANLPFPSRTEPDEHGATQLDPAARAAAGNSRPSSATYRSTSAGAGSSITLSAADTVTARY